MDKLLPSFGVLANKTFAIREIKDSYFNKQWSAHPEYLLVAIVRGTGTRYIGDNFKSFKGGDIVLTGPGLPHVWRSDNAYFDLSNGLDIYALVLYFPINFIGSSTLQKEEFAQIKNLLKQAERGLELFGEENEQVIHMMRELVKLKGVSAIIKMLEILDTIANTSAIKPITRLPYSYKQTTQRKDIIGEVIEYILKNYKERITIQQVASIANMSESAFSRHFKAQVNKSFSEFVGDVRISNARKLLQTENLNISQVCFESGFPTLSNFNKQFKERVGKTPLAYKKSFLKSFK